MKTVLLYSGGIDSYCLARIVKPDVLLYVDMGTKYTGHEILRLKKPLGCENSELVYESMEALGRFEREEDGIIPARNAMLILLAAQYGDEIIIGSTASDKAADNCEPFTELMNKMLTELWKPQWWLPDGIKKSVVTPLKGMTKSHIVSEYIRSGGDVATLRDCFSCYTPNKKGKECGNCPACGQKWIALMNNCIVPVVDASQWVRSHYWLKALTTEWDRSEQDRNEVLNAYHNYQSAL